MYFIATWSISISQQLLAETHFYLSTFELYRKTPYFADHVRVVIFRIRASRIYLSVDLCLIISTFYICTVEKAYRKTCPIPPFVKSTVLLRIAYDFLVRKSHISNVWISVLPTTLLVGTKNDLSFQGKCRQKTMWYKVYPSLTQIEATMHARSCPGTAVHASGASQPLSHP